jgi:dolichol-phosphate mannosyltransferase
MKKIVFIPTFNERKNISILIKKILNLKLNFDILIIDDNSSDGTRNAIDKLKKINKKIHTIYRKQKLGIGSAHKEAFKWCYKKKYKVIISMDGDGTHDPKYIPNLLKKSTHYDIISTTRFKKKNSLNDWPAWRIILTKLRHLILVNLLKLEFDASGAFRLINPTTVDLRHLLAAKNNSYSFFWESLFILKYNKYSIHEIPISLNARKTGNSKMSIMDIFRALSYLFIFYFNRK